MGERSTPYTFTMKNTQLSLQALISASAAGDHASFSELYKRTHVHLFGVIVRMLNNRHQAEDVLQEAFVSIWKSASTYRIENSAHDGQAIAWLTAIVRNKALDVLRDVARRKEDHASESDDDGRVDAGAAQSALELFTTATSELQIGNCMAQLDGGHRQSLALAYYMGFSHAEVAQHMHVPLGSVKSWVRRGLEKLKSCLAQRGVVA